MDNTWLSSSLYKVYTLNDSDITLNNNIAWLRTVFSIKGLHNFKAAFEGLDFSQSNTLHNENSTIVLAVRHDARGLLLTSVDESLDESSPSSSSSSLSLLGGLPISGASRFLLAATDH